MKKLLTISMLAALALTFGATSAEAGHRGRGKDAKGDRITRMVEQLELSAEQQAALVKLRDEMIEDAEPIMAKLRAVRDEQRTLWQADDIDEARVKALHKKAHRLEGQLEELRIELRLDVVDLLTPEQRAELKELGARRFTGGKHQGKRDGKRGGMGRSGKAGFDRRFDRQPTASPTRARAVRGRRPVRVDADR